MKELEIGRILVSELESDGWTCVQNKAGKKGAGGIDIILVRNEETFGIECKGDSKANRVDFLTLLGQSAIMKSEHNLTHNAICISEKYIKYCQKHAKTLKALGLLIYIVDDEGCFYRYFDADEERQNDPAPIYT